MILYEFSSNNKDTPIEAVKGRLANSNKTMTLANITKFNQLNFILFIYRYFASQCQIRSHIRIPTKDSIIGSSIWIANILVDWYFFFFFCKYNSITIILLKFNKDGDGVFSFLLLTPSPSYERVFLNLFLAINNVIYIYIYIILGLFLLLCSTNCMGHVSVIMVH